jgi:hypothetical protein
VTAYDRLGAITDDTQMTLFTTEGLLRAQVRGSMLGLSTFAGVTDHAYLRWLETQGQKSPVEIGRDGWLWTLEDLHSRRVPGNTCLSALKSKKGLGDAAQHLKSSKAMRRDEKTRMQKACPKSRSSDAALASFLEGCQVSASAFRGNQSINMQGLA